MSDLNQYGDQLQKILEDLHTDLAKKLLDGIRAGDVTPALLNVARQFLKDNGIDGVPTNKNPLGRLAKELPKFDDPDVSEDDLPERRH